MALEVTVKSSDKVNTHGRIRPANLSMLHIMGPAILSASILYTMPTHCAAASDVWGHPEQGSGSGVHPGAGAHSGTALGCRPR